MLTFLTELEVTNEKSWLDDLRKGDHEALEEFYAKSRTKFLNWSKRNYNLEENEAVDIYQDAIVVFYDKVVTGHVQSLVVDKQTYLFGIAKNLILKHYRKERVNEKKHSLWQQHILEKSAEEADSVELTAQLMTNAVGQLQEPCRTILTLFYYYQKDFDFIAKKVGHSDKNVTKTQKSRCLGYLRETYLKKLKYEY